MAYLLDTNIFNKLLDGDLQFEQLPTDGPLLATYLQLKEIGDTNNTERRIALQNKFHEINPQPIPVESSLWNVTPWGEGKYGGQGNFYNYFLTELNQKNKSKKSNYADALIAEVVITNRYILLTADHDLAVLVTQKGGQVFRFTDKSL
jgi:hypothetical protein